MVREAKNTIKHKLRKARNTKADKDWEDLRSHQAQYKKLVKNARSSSWREYCKGLDSKSTSKKISNIVKNNKYTKLGTVRKPDGKLTDSPKETLNEMTNVHFKEPPPPNKPKITVPQNHRMTEEQSGKRHTSSLKDELKRHWPNLTLSQQQARMESVRSCCKRDGT